jgi:proteasome lid subunit RPN8/RPN11
MEALKVVYDSLVYWQIMHWVQKANDDEVSGFGKVIKEGSVLKVVSAMLLPQRNGRANTEIEGADVGKAEYQLRNQPGELRLWWHSHVKMGCFWSQTDIDTIKELGKHGWILATVFNQHWDKRSAIFQGGDDGVFVDNIATTNIYNLTQEQTRPWDEEFDKNVTQVALSRWKGAAAETAANFREWKKHQLSKRERELVGANVDPVLGIFITKNHGKVIWRESNNRTMSVDVPEKDNAHITRCLMRSQLLDDAVHVRYANEEMLQSMHNCVRLNLTSNPVILKCLEKMEKKQKEKGKVLMLPQAGSPNEIPDESFDDDDIHALVDKHLRGQEIDEKLDAVDEHELERLFPAWHQLSAKDRNEWRQMYLEDQLATGFNFGI